METPKAVAGYGEIKLLGCPKCSLGFSIRCYGKDIKILFQSNSILEATLTDLLGTFLITVIPGIEKTYQQYSDKDVLASKIRMDMSQPETQAVLKKYVEPDPCAFSLGSTRLNLNGPHQGHTAKVSSFPHLHNKKS